MAIDTRPSATGKWSRVLSSGETGSARWASFAPSSHDDPRGWGRVARLRPQERTPEFARVYCGFLFGHRVMNGSLRASIWSVLLRCDDEDVRPARVHARDCCGGKTIFEWQGQAFGRRHRGDTIVTETKTASSRAFRLYHRPFRAVIQFPPNWRKRLPARSAPRCSSGDPNQAGRATFEERYAPDGADRFIRSERGALCIQRFGT